MKFNKIISFLKELNAIGEYYFHEMRIFSCFIFTVLGTTLLILFLYIDAFIRIFLSIKLNIFEYFAFIPLFGMILFILCCLSFLQIENYLQINKKSSLNSFLKGIVKLETYLKEKRMLQIILLFVTFFVFKNSIKVGILFMFIVLFLLGAQIVLLINDLFFTVSTFITKKMNKKKKL